ncbi:MAG: YlxR family protein [Clostridia bacterium]|nr:YlxR family protein [Clostridia bacterium]
MKKSIRHKGAKVRMCAACGLRARRDEHEFIRITLQKDGTLIFDSGDQCSGRSAYVCRQADCVKKLCKSRRLSHLLRGSVPEEVYQSLLKEAGLSE